MGYESLNNQLMIMPLDQVIALKSINHLPVDLNQSLLVHYPAMKLGMSADVAFYADKLAAIAKALIKDQPENTAWVITAPFYHVIPSAANLISWQVFKLLKQALGSSYLLFIVNLRVPKKSILINDAQAFKTYYDYCNKSIAERIKLRAQLHQNLDDILNHKANFYGRGVIVINDIKVTGTQQKFMQKSFYQVHPACLHWLYIIEVDENIGIVDPQIEHRINHSKLQSLDEFSKLMGADAIVYTARCILKLFSYDLDKFQFLVQKLSLDKRIHILKLALEEGGFEGEFFTHKMALLTTLCADHESFEKLIDY